jgi:hypothetical protein
VRSLLAHLFSASAVVAATVTFAPTPVQAASEAYISSATVTPATQAINGDAGCGNKVKISVDVYDPDRAFSTGDLNAEVTDGAGELVDYPVFYLDKRSGDHVTTHAWVFTCAGIETPGKYHARIVLDWYDDDLNLHESLRDRYFTIQRPTSLTYDASPEPVKRGTSLTHKGQLKFDPYGFGSMYGPSGVTVTLFFKKNGTSTYVSKGSVQTGSNGAYTKKITASDSGTWKAVYAGSSTRQAQTVYDSVSVG